MECRHGNFWIGLGIGSILGAVAYRLSRTAKAKQLESEIYNAIHRIGRDAEIAAAHAERKAVDLGLKAVETGAEIADKVAGVINIGPFGCMPSRIAEAVLNEKLEERKLEISKDKPHVQRVLSEFENLPFMTIEVDGSPLSQLVEAKLESFMLQVDRVHNEMKKDA
mgnify:CR=1 FL=1